MKIFWNGLKFGMLLQMAVGPMCLLVFNTAQNMGLLRAFSLVIAIALVDAFYIASANIGISRLLDTPKCKKIFKWLGAFVLMLFGANIILSEFGLHIIPALNLKPTTTSIFLQGIILTLSNPMTIIFWSGILVDKILQDKFQKNELVVFSFGLVSATLIFLSCVAVLGTLLSTFIPNNISVLLNVIVGMIIVCFAIKLLIKK